MVKLLCLLAITAFGLLSVEANGESRIVGSFAADKGQFPYQVQILNVAHERPFCGGSIVGERFVLTSAYCIKQHADEFEKLRIIVGEVDIRTKDGTEHVVDKLIPHPQYRVGSSNRNYDIGLVRVARPFEYTEDVQPIRLPTEDTRVQSDDRVVLSGMISGWGPFIVMGSHYLLPSDVLRWKTTETLSRRECSRLMESPPFFSSYAICIKNHPRTGPCESDGGGALTTKAKRAEERVIIGVLDWTEEPCVNQLPHIATRVFPHLRFIRRAMQT